jgi:hypothetical protein
VNFDELRRDIEEHIEHETHDNIDRGMTPESARAAALRKFGNPTRVAEETWSGGALSGLIVCCRTPAMH